MDVPERVYLRVLRKTEPGEGGCVLSRYSLGSHGYPQVGWNEKGKRTVTLCHLAVWRYLNGEPGDGMTVDHRCHVKRCVNIEHLRVLTNLENARRNGSGDWPVDGRCINGHEEEFWRPKGEARKKGYCSECRREKRLTA